MAPSFDHLNIQPTLPVTTLATIVGAIILLGMYCYQKKRKDAIPNDWRTVGKVKNLFLYPLKSGRRMELKSAECTEFGLQIKTKSGFPLRDRCLVVYKESNKEFKTARTYPKLVLINVTLNDDGHFIVNAPGMESLSVKVPSLKDNCKSDEIVFWDNEKICTLDCGDEVAEWLSNYILENSCGMRLGFHDGSYRRNIEGIHQEFMKVYPKLGNSSTGMYSDLASFLVMNQASVDDLVNRIQGSTVTVNNFRPNIVVEGKRIGPYVEDNWDWVRIGEVVMRNVKPCTRCSFTTIDPETGLRSRNNEPLKTLKTYRRVKDFFRIDLEGEDPVMGIYTGLEQGGEISVGDTVYVGEG